MSDFKTGLIKVANSNKLYVFQAVPILVASLMGLSVLSFANFLPNKLPLFYSLSWGDNQLATLQQFFIIPGVLLLVTLGNLIISWQLHVSQSFFKKVLLISSLINTLILTITFIKIVFIFI